MDIDEREPTYQGLDDDEPLDLDALAAERDQAYHDTITRYIRELAGDQEIDITTRLNLLMDIEVKAGQMVESLVKGGERYGL